MCVCVCVYIYMCVCVYIYILRREKRLPLLLRALLAARCVCVLYKGFVLRRGCCARINHPFTPPPPTCIAHPGAILLHDDLTV